MRRSVSVLMIAVALPLAGCLDSKSSWSGSITTPPRATAAVGGNISGLSGTTTLVLNGSEELTLSQNGAFQFATQLAAGQPYFISVGTQPAHQTCTVANDSGTVANTSHSEVSVTCATHEYAIGGAISGLNGTVQLQNGSELLSVSANGSFVFPTRVPSGSSFAISVATQPAGAQCDVVSGAGIVGSEDVSTVAVQCRATYSLGGIVTGLVGSLILSQNGEVLTLADNGPFAFPTPVAQGATYAVTVQTQPATQTCTLSNGSGTMRASDTHDISVSCVTNVATVSGTVSGLVGGYESDVVLKLNGSETVVVSTDGAFAFSTALPVGTAYAVTVDAHPGVPPRSCSVDNATGSMANAGVNVTVTCVAPIPRLVFMSGAASDDLSVYSIDPATGLLSHASSIFTQADLSFSLALTPDKRFLYMPDMTNNKILAYAVDAVNGTLSVVPGSPYAVATNRPRTISITPDGRFLYAIGQSGNSIAAFAINAVTGALSVVGTPVSTGGQPLYSLITPNGKYLYTASFDTRSVYGYAIDAATGALTQVGVAALNASMYGRALAVDPRGKFLYATSYSANVAAFSIDDDTGALSPVSGSPFATGGTQSSFAVVEPSGRFLYVSNSSSNDISAYSINGATGALTPLPGSPFANGAPPHKIKTDPSGKFLYVSNQTAGQVNVYTIDATTGLITRVPGAPFSTGLNPGGLAILTE